MVDGSGEGGGLDEVVAVTQRAGAQLRTMGVALSPCILPAVGTAIPAGIR